MDKLNCRPLTSSQYFQKHNVSFHLFKPSFMPVSKVLSYRSFRSIIKITSGYFISMATIVFSFIVNPCWYIASQLTHTAVYMSGRARVMEVIKLDQNSPRQREEEEGGEGNEDEDWDKGSFTSLVALSHVHYPPPTPGYTSTENPAGS